MISKQLVVQAYRKVKANKGSSGIDGESIEAFEVNQSISDMESDVFRQLFSTLSKIRSNSKEVRRYKDFWCSYCCRQSGANGC